MLKHKLFELNKIIGKRMGSLKEDIEKSFGAVAGFSTYSTDVSRIFHYISIFENLWAQAGLYHQVKKANEKLIMQDKKYREFISTAAHELRAPLQPIIGLSYLYHLVRLRLFRSQILEEE